MTDSPGSWASPGGWTSPSDEPAPLLDTPALPPPPTPGFQAPPGWGGPQTTTGGWGAPRPPEVRPGVVPLRPLGLGELLDGAVAVIRRYPRPALGLSAAVAIVSTVLNVALALTALEPLLSLDSTTFSEGNTDQLEGALGGAALGGAGTAIISGLSTLLLTGIMTAIAGRAVLGQPMSFGEAWAQVRPALPRLLGIAVLTSAIVYGTLIVAIAVAVGLVAAAGAGGAFLAVPLGLGGVVAAVYLYGRLALAPAVALLEKAGVRTSLRRSGILVRRSWWRVIGILSLTLLIGSFVAQIVQVPFLIFGALPNGLSSLTNPTGGGTLLLVLGYIGAGIAQTVVAPFTAGVRALLYIDRRMRAEGLDVALTASLATPAS